MDKFKKPPTPAINVTGGKGQQIGIGPLSSGSGSGTSRVGTPIPIASSKTPRYVGGSGTGSARIPRPRILDKSLYTSTPPSSSRSGFLSLEKKNSAIHGSMEDIHRPKNFRKEASMIPAKKELNVGGHYHGAGDYGTSGSNTPLSSTRGPQTPKHHNFGFAESSSAQTYQQVEPRKSDETHVSELYEYIKKEKTQALVRKAVGIFIFGALKKQSRNYEELQEIRKILTMQIAARKIQFSLLLNAWRKQREELNVALQENAQLTISVENLDLQLRVSKHLHATERERVLECENEVRALKNQLGTCQKNLKTCEAELSSVQEELRFVREDREKLEEHKAFLVKELGNLKEEKQALVTELEKSRQSAQEIELELKQAKAQALDLKRQSKEVTIQCRQLEDKCKDLEAEGWELKLNLERKNQTIGELEMNIQTLKQEHDDLLEKKKTIQDAYFEISEKLRTCFEDNRSLHEELIKKAEENEDQVAKLMTLEDSREKLLAENDKLRGELNVFKLKHLHTRRGWVNSLGQLTFGGLFRLFFPRFGTSRIGGTGFTDVDVID